MRTPISRPAMSPPILLRALALTLTTATLLLPHAEASARIGKAYRLSSEGQNHVEIGFPLRIFGSTNKSDSVPVARGVAELPFSVEIRSAAGPVRCSHGTVSAGARSARALLSAPSAPEKTEFSFSISNGEEVLCRSEKDRKLTVIYRFRKNIAENIFVKQVDQTLAELKTGVLSSDFAKAVIDTALSGGFRTVDIHAAKAEVIVLDSRRAPETPMVTLIAVSPMKLSGNTVLPSGKPGTKRKDNLYPNANRFALICGYADEKDASIATPWTPSDQKATSALLSQSLGLPFGCIVNNSPDGFDAIDPYVEDPKFTLRYMMMPEAELRSGLETLKIKITESIDADRAKKLSALAESLLEANQKRVQEEVTRRRLIAMKAAGYLTQTEVSLQPQTHTLWLSGKPRWRQGPAGKLLMDTVFDVQGERTQYEFVWVDSSRVQLTENRSWTGLKAPLISKDYDESYMRFKSEYRVCASRSSPAISLLKKIEAAPQTYPSSDLIAYLTRETGTACTSTTAVEKRIMKYSHYEGECFEETPYRAKDSGQELVRFRPTRFSLVYKDDSGNATAKLPLDLAKLGDAAGLFSGLDVITTLPFDSARAKSYRVQCGAGSAFPAHLFDPEQLQSQMKIPGFGNLIGTATSAPSSAAPGSEAAKPARPQSGKIIL